MQFNLNIVSSEQSHTPLNISEILVSKNEKTVRQEKHINTNHLYL